MAGYHKRNIKLEFVFLLHFYSQEMIRGKIDTFPKFVHQISVFLIPNIVFIAITSANPFYFCTAQDCSLTFDNLSALIMNIAYSLLLLLLLLGCAGIPRVAG